MSCSPRLYGLEFLYELFPRDFLGLATIPGTHGAQGYMSLRPFALFSIISTADVTLTINADGTNHAFTIPSTGGVKQKVHLPLPVMKAKLFAYQLSCPQTWEHFPAESEIAIGQWGRTSGYVTISPTGPGGP